MENATHVSLLLNNKDEDDLLISQIFCLCCLHTLQNFYDKTKQERTTNADNKFQNKKTRLMKSRQH